MAEIAEPLDPGTVAVGAVTRGTAPRAIKASLRGEIPFFSTSPPAPPSTCAPIPRVCFQRLLLRSSLRFLALAMAPKKRGGAKKARDEILGLLEDSTIQTEARLALAREVTTAETNEHPSTVIHPGSIPVASRTALMRPIYLGALLAGLVPPFSFFFLAILGHYRIQPLHLHNRQ